jgi:hypothetical protein
LVGSAYAMVYGKTPIVVANWVHDKWDDCVAWCRRVCGCGGSGKQAVVGAGDSSTSCTNNNVGGHELAVADGSGVKKA